MLIPGEDEGVPQVERLELGPGVVVIVLRADRRDDAVPVERPDERGAPLVEHGLVAIGERAAPQRVIEIPDDQLDLECFLTGRGLAEMIADDQRGKGEQLVVALRHRLVDQADRLVMLAGRPDQQREAEQGGIVERREVFLAALRKEGAEQQIDRLPGEIGGTDGERGHDLGDLALGEAVEQQREQVGEQVGAGFGCPEIGMPAGDEHEIADRADPPLGDQRLGQVEIGGIEQLRAVPRGD